jgi:hypothetical protein
MVVVLGVGLRMRVCANGLTDLVALARLPGRCGSGFTEDYAGFGQIVRRQLDLHFVTRDDANKVLSHLPGDMGKHITAIRQIHPEHRAWEDGRDYAFYFYGIFLRHEPYFVSPRAVREGGKLGTGGKFEIRRPKRRAPETASNSFGFLISSGAKRHRPSILHSQQTGQFRIYPVITPLPAWTP